KLDDEEFSEFSESCLQFSKEFAAKMFVDDNKVVITRDTNWKKFLGNEDIENSLLRFTLLESFESASNTALFNKQSFASEHGVRQFLVEHVTQKWKPSNHSY
ncbi:33084_t:CDS:2, partial [Racocetra persica]